MDSRKSMAGSRKRRLRRKRQTLTGRLESQEKRERSQVTSAANDVPIIKSRSTHSMVFHHRHRNLYIFWGQRRRKHTMDFIAYDVDAGELNILDLDTTTVGERNVARNAREENMDAAADINPRLLENLELVLREINAHALCY
ncbi:hypothetical protein DMENIID0001_005650 [Sergentomyia squamirostris]